MKRSINKLVFGLTMAAVTAFGAVGAFAQTPAAAATPDPAAEKAAAYEKFLGCYKAADDAGKKACLAVGEDYLTKYGTPEDDYNKFVKGRVATMKKYFEGKPLTDAYVKLDSSVKAKDWKGAFDAGRTILQLEKSEPLKLDVTLTLATIGYDNAFAATPDNSLNTEAMNYAKSAIRMIEGGTASEEKPGPNNSKIPPTWGLGIYSYKSKDNALAWMNFTVARLISDTNKDQARALALYKEAAPYYFKVTKMENTELKTNPLPYQNIARYYREEYNAQVDAYKPCEGQTEFTEDCKKIIGLQLAYAERGADAFARAYTIAKNDPKATPAFRDSLLKSTTDFYNVRFKKTDGVNDFVTKTATTPLADPTAAVTPVPEETPTTTTGAASTTPAAAPKPAATAPATTVKPATTAPAAKPAATPAKPASSGTKVSKVPAKKKAAR